MHDEYLFTDEMKQDFICHPTADAPRFNNEGETLSDVYGKYSDEKKRRSAIVKGFSTNTLNTRRLILQFVRTTLLRFPLILSSLIRLTAA